MPVITLPRRLFEVAASTALKGFPDGSDLDHPGYQIAPQDVWNSLSWRLSDLVSRALAPTITVILTAEELDCWSAVFDVMAQGPEEGDKDYVSDLDCIAIIAAGVGS